MKRARLHNQVADFLVREIVTGAIAPGTYLFSENRLASELGVSRTVIREALMELRTRGLVEIEHGRGARIQQPDRWNIFDLTVIEALQDTGGVVPILKDLIEVRHFIEVAAAELAARRCDDVAITTLAQCVRDMESTLDDPAEYFRLDISFHEQLYRAAGNLVLTRLIEPIRALLMAARKQVIAVASPRGLRESLDGHRRVLDAIRARDPEGARTAMADHLRLAEAELTLAAGMAPSRSVAYDDLTRSLGSTRIARDSPGAPRPH